MALLNNTRFNFVDVMQREARDGNALLLGNSLAQSNLILQDLMLMEGTEKRGNLVGKAASLGTASRRRANRGVAPSKAAVVQQLDTISLWADRIEIDNLVYNQAKDKNIIIQQELELKRDNLNISMSADIFYGNPGDTIDSMTGIQPRLNSLSHPTVISAGGSAANTSIYLLTHDINSFFAFYPLDMQAGLSMVDRGDNERIADSQSTTGYFYGKVVDLEWAMGVTMKNERRNGRVCNIATGSLSKFGNTASNGPDLEDLIAQMLAQLQNVSDGDNKRLYVNRAIFSYLTRQFLKKTNHWITREEQTGKGLLYSVMGIPVRLVEQITNAETTVS